MPTTAAPWLVPYPVLGDTPDVPRDIKAVSDRLQLTMGQAWPCTSGTRPAHAAGRFIWETDTGAVYISDGTTWQPILIGGAWAAYTPVVAGYTTITTARSGRYRRVGKSVQGWAAWNVTGGTTSGSALITVTLPPHPVSASYPATAAVLGVAEHRTNAGVYVSGFAEAEQSATTFTILMQLPSAASVNHLRVTGAFNGGAVIGDQWFARFDYETT